MSYVSDPVLDHIRMFLFPCAENSKIHEAYNPRGHGPPFVVPDEHYEDLYIRYRFRGTSEQSVEVYGPADPFLCTYNPHERNPKSREGLLFSNDTLENVIGSKWVFGLVRNSSLSIAYCVLYDPRISCIRCSLHYICRRYQLVQLLTCGLHLSAKASRACFGIVCHHSLGRVLLPDASACPHARKMHLLSGVRSVSTCIVPYCCPNQLVLPFMS